MIDTDVRPHLDADAEVEIGARLVRELAALTRVLLGVQTEPATQPTAQLFAQPAVPAYVEEPVFVAPPVVEVAPLLDDRLLLPPAPPRPDTSILREVAFLDL